MKVTNDEHVDAAVAERAAAFGASARGCLRGCGAIIGFGVVIALLAYAALAIYLTVVYHKHPY